MSKPKSYILAVTKENTQCIVPKTQTSIRIDLLTYLFGGFREEEVSYETKKRCGFC